MLIKDEQIVDQYKDFIEKSLTYVVSCVKFLSFSHDPDRLIKPAYLPYQYVVSFNKNYDNAVGSVARMVNMDKENPHLYVRGRLANKLSLKPMDAYREIFDGNNQRGFSHVIFPVHSILTAHFKPEKEQFYNPLDNVANARSFVERAEAPSVESKCKHMVFYAETFGNLVSSKHRKTSELRNFYQALEENCAAVQGVTQAYRNMTKSLEKYIN